MAEDTIRTVDFIPQYDILGDIKKVSEYDFSIYNAKIIPIITILCMERGSNVLVPDMGLREVLRSLPYREFGEMYPIIEGISNHLYFYTGYTVKAYIDEADPLTDYQKGEFVIRIDVEGIPEPISVNVNKSNTFYVRHPMVFGGMSNIVK
jgi:hypothetical protein